MLLERTSATPIRLGMRSAIMQPRTAPMQQLRVMGPLPRQPEDSCQPAEAARGGSAGRVGSWGACPSALAGAGPGALFPNKGPPSCWAKTAAQSALIFNCLFQYYDLL